MIPRPPSLLRLETVLTPAALDQRRGQKWDQDLVVSSEAIAAAGALGGALDDVHIRPIGLYEVEIGRGEIIELVLEIARQGHCLQKDLRQHHRRADVDIDAATTEPGDLARKGTEV